MKRILLLALLLSCSVAFAQQTIEIKQGGIDSKDLSALGGPGVKVIKGSDLNKMFPTITDKRIYDRAGNIIDSAEAKEKVKTFEYTLGWGIPDGQTETKRMLFKVDHSRESQIDAYTKMNLRPSSPKLWEGVTLDLNPLASRTDIKKLDGKAVVLIFRTEQYGTQYSAINDAIANSIDGGKFEVFAITYLDYDRAMRAQKAAPILNAHNIIDAQTICDAYGVGTGTVVVATNKLHQITFAITNYASMTPRTLNKLLKEL